MDFKKDMESLLITVCGTEFQSDDGWKRSW